MTGQPSDRVLEVARVLTTALKSGAAGAKLVVLDLEGLPDVDVSDPTAPQLQRADGQGSRTQEAEPFSSLGAVARPLPPADGQHALVLCVRAGDELIPIGVSDPRLALAGNGPGSGAVGIAGYGGAFYTTQPVDTSDLSRGSVHTVYCPYDIGTDGVAAHAHVIQIHPEQGITIAHADGMALTLHDDKVVLRSNTGAASIVLDGSNIQLNGTIQLNGSVGVTSVTSLGVTLPIAVIGATPPLPGPLAPLGPSFSV
jgi:hypothetical protein